jgi:signal transduction histidine kinase
LKAHSALCLLHPFFMSIKARLLMLCGVLLVAFAATLFGLRVLGDRKARELRAEARESSRQDLERWIDLTRKPLTQFLRDYAEWDEMKGFFNEPNPGWAAANLHRNLPAYGAHAVWALRPDATVLHASSMRPGPPLAPPALAEQLAAAGPLDFFAESRDGLLEVHGVRVGDRGWLVASRAWNDEFAETLSRLAGARIRISPAGAPAPTGTEPAARLPLAGPDGRVLRVLDARFPDPAPENSLWPDLFAVQLFVVFGLLLVVAVGLSLRAWVIRPLDTIETSLQTRDPAALQPLLAGQADELTRVAGLVQSSFTHRALLEHEVEERRRTEAALRESEARLQRSIELRSRLARDLHDGVIQSIYAAGLGVESAAGQLAEDRTGVRERLLACRESLNGIIREVRGFINGLEPETLHRQSFAQALEALASTMQALWPVKVEVRLDESAGRALTAAQEVHALQIARECISNAMRHGAARQIGVHLTRQGQTATLEVRDDGQGFDPALRTGTGNGLGNLATRAREMGGVLRLHTEAGRGTGVIIDFPLAEAPI